MASAVSASIAPDAMYGVPTVLNAHIVTLSQSDEVAVIKKAHGQRMRCRSMSIVLSTGYAGAPMRRPPGTT